MNAFLESLTHWLIDFFLLTSLLLAASLALRLMVRGPAARVSLAWGTWLGIATIAVLTALPAWPRFEVHAISQAWSAPAVDARVLQPEANLLPVELPIDVAVADSPAPAVDLAPLVREFDSPAMDAPDRLALSNLAAGVWLAAAALGLAWILIGLMRTRGLLVRATGVPRWVHDELQRIIGAGHLPGLWSSERIQSAVAIGAMRPQIVLPHDCISETNSPAVRAALAHEWAHIRHGDLWLLALERCLLPLLAVHPLFWWLRRGLRLDQELLADAAAAGQERVEYAEALLAWATLAEQSAIRPSRHGLAAIGMWENPNTLSRRVAMILDPKLPLARPLGRGWTLALAALLAPVVVGLSLVTLRPVTAQEEAVEAIPAAPLSPDGPATELPRSSRTVISRIPVAKIQLDLLLMSVSREKLAAAETTLEDAIAEATASRCRREAGLVVSGVTEDEVKKLLETLKRHDALRVMSRPKVLTLDGVEAMVQVGEKTPVLRVEETVNGEHERRVEYKEFGTLLMVRPKIAGKDGELIALDIVAEQSKLLPRGEQVEEGAVPRDVPGLISHKFKLSEEVKLGGSLLVAESSAGKKQLGESGKHQFLMIVTPQRAVREVAAFYSDPAAGAQGEAARKDAEAAIEAATAAEPGPGTAAAALLKAEREARAKETAALKRQVDALQQELKKLRGQALGDEPAQPAMLQTIFRLHHVEARELAAQLDEVLAKPPFNGRKIAFNISNGEVVVSAPEPLMAEVRKVIELLDKRAANPPVELKDDVQYLPPGPERKQPTIETRVFRFRPGAARQHQSRLHEVLSKPPIADMAITINVKGDSQGDLVEVSAPAKGMAEIRKLLEPLGAEEIAANRLTGAAAASTGQPSRALDQKLFELDVAQARLAVEAAEKDWQRIQQLREQNAISQEEVDQKQIALALTKIELQKAMAKLEAVTRQNEDAPAAEAAPAAGQFDQRTAVRLLELDVAEAKAVLEVNEAELSQALEVQDKSPGAVSQAELRKYRAAVERAKIQLQRVMIKLEATQEPRPQLGR